MNMSIHRSRSCTGSLALYSSLVSSVLKKLLTDGCPARSTWTSSPSRRRLHRPQILISGSAPRKSVGISMAVEKTLAAVLESTPVQGDSPGRVSSVKLRLPEVSKSSLTPSKSKKNASLRAPAKNEKPPDVATWGSSPTKETGTAEKILSPTASGDSASSSVAKYTSTVCLPSTGSEKT